MVRSAKSTAGPRAWVAVSDILSCFFIAMTAQRFGARSTPMKLRERRASRQLDICTATDRYMKERITSVVTTIKTVPTK
jgi:hypothetical protein